MRELPILFSGAMVRAILAGRKTQTRRVMKPQPDSFGQPSWLFGDGHSGVGWYCGESDYPDEGSLFWRCPYGAEGDRLYVRESFAIESGPGGYGYRYKADGGVRQAGAGDWLHIRGEVFDAREMPIEGYSYRPSIHMPKMAARIWLEVTGVRVERLQAMPWQDAIAEGIKSIEAGATRIGSPALEFAMLWDGINAARGYSWESNPWVWVVEFRRVEP